MKGKITSQQKICLFLDSELPMSSSSNGASFLPNNRMEDGIQEPLDTCNLPILKFVNSLVILCRMSLLIKYWTLEQELRWLWEPTATWMLVMDRCFRFFLGLFSLLSCFLILSYCLLSHVDTLLLC